ncbi:proline--tRNA ligase [Fusobacterium ulcerans]|uniref:Proline--tRNA ligase n=1 Tax=Fusobacterium ulcerans TaxID=861 RepID=A0AAX2JDH0_9FUSO|nr:proline--tRNA ligase [Fusobacterium ulcerans]AVQ27125.1 proline--tRNA ligase [Fusobacterium ulcerans]EFS24746.1 prolyl-tRNA synthetase [Fusobacterium ulcerans ATCC 49185]SQJ10926.1 Proline--tRNA ligase [Fusobacterium ulcerans]
MRFSKSYIKTLKETPKEAETASHKLLLRASMIKKLTSGVYTYLPLGYKALKKVENIVREEMDRAGSQEILMPVLQPAELWKESGRWDVMGPLMMKLQDRNKRDFVLGPTHEEVVTDLIRNDISSYKALPLSLYQIQTKFRDEIRPRFGLMRGREFVMKDAYSFHATAESLDEEFLNMRDTYSRIFSRCGLKFRPVEADSGAIGGSGSQEFHVLADSGEDEIIYCDSCSYAANVETAVSRVEASPVEELKNAELIDTPNVSKIDDIVQFLNIPYSKTVKAMMYRDMGNDQVYMVLMRGDYEVNETKLKNIVNAVEVALLTDEELEKHGLIKGFIGPYGIELGDIKVIADTAVTEINNHTAGGNKMDTHYINVNYGRDYKADIVADIKTVKVGETCERCGGKLHSARGIEVGHIFKLGDKYSKALNATFLDDKGESKVMLMGCYGIGVSRTLASAIEQNNDEFGIIWPTALAPYIVDVIPANVKNEEQVKVAEEIYEALLNDGIDSMIDDRDERPGFKFKDADLIGFPFKVVSGKRAGEGIVELKIRRTGETLEISKDDVVSTVRELMKKY